MRSVLVLGVLACVVVSSAPALAQTANEARAESLYNEGKLLREGGRVAEACPMFAESKQLAPGVGISLHLADCYERVGKTGSALGEFREAEKLARAQGDAKRAQLAHDRAHSLEPKVGQLTVASPAGPHDGWQLALDGTPLAADHLDVPLPVDPGDHVVTVTAPGQPPRPLSVHIEAPNLVATLHTDAPPAGAAPAVASPPPSEAAPGAPSPSVPETPVETGGGGKGRLWAEIALAGVGLAGVGLGTAFLINRNNAMNNGTACDPPTVDQGDTTAAVISYSVGGAAFVTAVVLYLTTPHKSQLGVTVAPTLVAGGGGALLHARF